MRSSRRPWSCLYPLITGRPASIRAADGTQNASAVTRGLARYGRLGYAQAAHSVVTWLSRRFVRRVEFRLAAPVRDRANHGVMPT